MSSQCIVPDWNLRHQRQQQLQGDETDNRSSHVPKQLLQNPTAATASTSSHLVPMSNYAVTELTWENGHLAMHGLGGFLPTSNQATKPTWETLESIVHQATYHKQNQPDHHQTPPRTGPIVPSMDVPADSSSPQMAPTFFVKKRTSSESNRFTSNQDDHHQHVDRSACGSATATAATFCRDNNDITSKTARTSWASFESPRSLIKNKTRDHEDSAKFCRDNDAATTTTTMMTWPSFESPRSLKTKTTDEDSDCHVASGNQDEDRETKTEIVGSQSSRRSRVAAVHNQSERRRRDRINQKMKALQKLVPNANKTDKASMLDEVIQYLKQLQAQVQMMSSVRNMMINPLGMQQQQQQLQMSLLARMGMGVGLGMGMGMFNTNTMAHSTPQSIAPLIHPSQVAAAAAAATSTFIPPQFVVPPTMIPTHASSGQSNQGSASNGSVHLPDPYCTFLAQSMNMELYNNMAALYRQQVNQSTQASSSLSMQSNHARGD